MSRQSTLDSYFKKSLRSPPVTKNCSDNNKKRLSLIKSPQQSKRVKSYNQESTDVNGDDDLIILPTKEQEVIILSDDEQFGDLWSGLMPTLDSSDRERDVDTSHETITYNFSPSMILQDTPEPLPSNSGVQNSDEHNPMSNPVQGTPQKSNSDQEFVGNSRETSPVRNHSSPITNVSPTTIFKTPKKKQSVKKFFSPTKKRLVVNRSPAKKNSTTQFNDTSGFWNVCDKEDDKTIFLLSIIDKYLKNDSLRCLLDKNSQALLAKSMHIKKPGMKLICRLYWHQRGWYRTQKLLKMCNKDENELDNLNLHALLQSGLVVESGSEGNNSMDFDDYANILKLPELQGVCKKFKLKIPNKKEIMVQQLKKYSQRKLITAYIPVTKIDDTKRVLNMLSEKAGPCYRLSDLASETIDSLYVIMYLGIDYSLMRDKKLEFMLINDKSGRETYPIDKNMPIDNASVVFQNREEFHRYMSAYKMYESYLAETSSDKIRDMVQNAYTRYITTDENEMLRCKSLPIWLRQYTAPSVYISIMKTGVDQLKKLKSEDAYTLALDILTLLMGQDTYGQHKKALWYEERALLLHKCLSRPEEAANLLLEGFRCDMSEQAKDCLRPRARLLANQQNISLDEQIRIALREHADRNDVEERSLPGDHILKPPLENHNQRGKQKFEHRTEEGRSTMSAEDYCILHYTSQGEFTHGEHWEGRIVTTIFFLLFWDIIYTKPAGVNGIFLSYYQRYPLDLFCESFYVNRKTLIEDRLTFIEECTDDMVVEIMQEKWDSRPETELSDIRRDIGWDNVRMVSRCMGSRSLASLCRRLAADYRGARSGFPDLTLWNIHTKKIKFVEVKTDNDKPSMKQIQWIRYLLAHGVDAGFCYIGANTTRNRKRGLNTGSPDKQDPQS